MSLFISLRSLQLIITRMINVKHIDMMKLGYLQSQLSYCENRLPLKP